MHLVELGGYLSAWRLENYYRCSALEVVLHDYALCKSTFTLLYFTLLYCSTAQQLRRLDRGKLAWVDMFRFFTAIFIIGTFFFCNRTLFCRWQLTSYIACVDFLWLFHFRNVCLFVKAAFHYSSKLQTWLQTSLSTCVSVSKASHKQVESMSKASRKPAANLLKT